MRRIILITFSVIAGFCVPLYASGSEEVFAEWEKEANMRLWNDRVRSDLGTFSPTKMSINTYCSSEFIEEIQNLRINAGKQIIDADMKGYSGEYVRFWSDVVKNSASVDTVPLTKNELSLLVQFSAEKLYIIMKDCMTATGTDTTILSGDVIFPLIIQKKLSFRSQGRSSPGLYYEVTEKTTRSVNLNIYSLDISMVNNFALFLYIWEDCPGRIKSNIYPSLLPALSFISLIPDPFKINFNNIISPETLQFFRIGETA